MSSKRFAYLMSAYHTNNDIHGARDAYHEYQVCHCLNPRLIDIQDSHTQTTRKIQIACGTCPHCMESKINEWVTRMYAHAEDFKNVYFVTLTYRSITDPYQAVNELLLNKLSQAVWNLDPFNSTMHRSYNPCLLCKDHYQKFLKRLRKNTGLKDLTYVLSGEYGKRWARPHMHIILFTNGTLTRQDIVRAWSVALWRDNSGKWSYRTSQHKNGVAYNFPIGHIDFHDLVSNGTFNTTAKIRIDGTYMNAANCFAYVCKYVVKRDKINYQRVNLAYRNLFHKETFVNLGVDPVQWKYIKQYFALSGISYDVETINNLKRFQYEKTIFEPCETIFKHGLLRDCSHQIYGCKFNEELLPSMYLDFRNKFSPFCEFSRGTPIGSVYATRNVQEFTQGVFTKPLLQESGFVVPNYFRTKAQEYVYGLREVRKTISGSSFAYGGLVDLQRLFDSGDFLSLSQGSHQRMLYYYPRVTKDLPFSRIPFVDKYTGERIVVADSLARYYKFDRHLKKYVNTRNMCVPDFIRYWSSALQKEMKRYSDAVAISKDNLRLQDFAQCLLTDLGDDPRICKTRFIDRYNRELNERQKMYHAVHKSVE